MMDAFVLYYWKRIWILNLFISGMVLWGVLDTIHGRYETFWMYIVLIIFSLFVASVRSDVKKDYLRRFS